MPRIPLFSLLVSIPAIVAAPSTTAQVSRNVQLLGTLDPAPRFSEYNDVWGYVDPATGKEYCLLGSEDGTHVIDCSDPANPVERGMIPSDSSFSSGNFWRDIKTYGSYAYVVSEAHGGMQIIDLRDADNPVKVKTWGSWSNAHNIGVDAETGIVYVCGTGRGTYAIDVASDPVNPTQLYRLRNPYIHDLSVHRGYGYFADQNGNNLQIYDVTQMPASMPRLSSVRMPGGSTAHATWPTRDNDYCLGANESSGGPVSIWDVTNKRLPRLLTTYTAGPSNAIPHNVFIRDRVAHISYYTEGYRTVDLSDPANPVEVGYYDTYSGASGGYDGAWGCYHLQPSGVIYISDVQSGLFIFKPASSAERYGDATTGSAGATPVIHAFGAAFVGNGNFALEAEAAPPARVGALIVGSGRTSVTVAGVAFHVPLVVPQPVIIPMTSDGAGTVKVPLPVPAMAAVAGATLNAQMVFIDSSAPFDWSATQGLEFSTFTP
ncbi:MAG: choice-of-anchor B family protein [Planctomycetota bacterium]